MHLGFTVNTARKTAITLGGIIMIPSLLLTSLASSPTIAVILIAIALFGFQVSINNIQTLPSDFYVGKNVGTVAGLGGTTAAIGVIITTYLVPFLTKTSYTWFFVMGAALVPVSILCVFVFGGKITRCEKGICK